MIDFDKDNNTFRIGFLQRAMAEKYSMGLDLAYSNFFLVLFPKELNITPYDVVSADFIGDNTCRIVIRNNYTNCPIFSLNAYRNKCKCFFCRRKCSMEIDYLNKKGEIQYRSVLKRISIDNIKESQLSYQNDEIQTITFDVKYGDREIIKTVFNTNAANSEGIKEDK